MDEWRAGAWRAKRETLPKLSTFLSQLKGGPFGEKTTFRRKPQNAEKLEGGPFGVFQHPFCGKTSKNWRGENFYFRKKISQCRKKLKGGPLGFSNIHSDAKQQKIEGGTLWGKNFRKKSLAVPKKIERGDAEKQEKPFWFSSLSQMVQFGAIIFCKTFKNYFGQFVWIEKKLSL